MLCDTFCLQSESGEVVNTLVGTRFTTVRFQDNADIRVNQLNISTETYNTILSNTFGICIPTGVDIQKTEDGIIMSMDEYADAIEDVEDIRKADNGEKLTKQKLKSYRKYTGWHQTPDQICLFMR